MLNEERTSSQHFHSFQMITRVLLLMDYHSA